MANDQELLIRIEERQSSMNERLVVLEDIEKIVSESREALGRIDAERLATIEERLSSTDRRLIPLEEIQRGVNTSNVEIGKLQAQVKWMWSLVFLMAFSLRRRGA